MVDDDPVVTKTPSRLLSKAGRSVSEVQTGGRALSLLSNNAFDLIMSHLVMEEMNGPDLLKQVKLSCPDV